MNGEMTLYEYSKQVVANEVPMDPIAFNQAMLSMSLDLEKSKYIMLLCHERRDYTLFNLNNMSDNKKFASDLAETLSNRGSLLLADKQPDGAWEIWIRDFTTDENFAYYLFDYSNGVVEVE